MKTINDIILDYNNQVYFDNELGEFYIIIWDKGYHDTPYRFYINSKTMELIETPVIK